MAGKGAGQQIKKCIEQAEYHLDNNGTMAELYQTVDRLLERLCVGLP